MTQKGYVKEILKIYGIKHCKPAVTLDPHQKLSISEACGETLADVFIRGFTGIKHKECVRKLGITLLDHCIEDEQQYTHS